MLQGMLLEARERYPEALEIYDKVLKEQPTHMVSSARKPTTHKKWCLKMWILSHPHSVFCRSSFLLFHGRLP